MKWKFKLGNFLGIDVYIHMTFFLILVWVAFSNLAQGAGSIGVIIGITFVLAIFACVTLHEYGHALAARRFGIKTRDIMLLPIGGVARLERMPSEPKQEIYVALAGPAVNLVIAALLFIWLHITASFEPLSEITMVSGPLLERLMLVNLLLLVFNMIPAFPMDGGRVLRAVLAMRGNYLRATRRAAHVGQGFAFLFGLAGLFMGNPMLVFIALFIWIGAAQESGATHMSTTMSGIPVSEAMVTDFKTLHYDDRLGEAIALTISGTQNDFPVLRGGEVVGILNQGDLIAALRGHDDQSRIDQFMQETFATVDAGAMLDYAFAKLSDCRCHTIPVLQSGRLVGLLTMDNVGEFVRIQSAKEHQRRHPDLPNVLLPML